MAGMADVAQSTKPLEEFLTDPLLTVAAVLLIVVAVLLVLFSRLISYNLKRAAKKVAKMQGRRPPPADDPWSEPPP